MTVLPDDQLLLAGAVAVDRTVDPDSLRRLEISLKNSAIPKYGAYLHSRLHVGSITFVLAQHSCFPPFILSLQIR